MIKKTMLKKDYIKLCNDLGKHIAQLGYQMQLTEGMKDIYIRAFDNLLAGYDSQTVKFWHDKINKEAIEFAVYIKSKKPKQINPFAGQWFN